MASDTTAAEVLANLVSPASADSTAPSAVDSGPMAPDADISGGFLELLATLFGEKSTVVHVADRLTAKDLVDLGFLQISILNVIVACLIVLLGFGVSFLLRLWLRRQIFPRFSLDDRTQSLTRHAINVVTVLLVVYYGLMALQVPIAEFLNQTRFTIKNTPISIFSLIAAIGFVLVTLFISRWVRALMQGRLFQRWNVDEGAQYVFLRLVHYLIVVAGVLIAVQSLGIQPTMFVGLLAVLGVGIGFGLQNLTSNFISGIILLFEQPIKVGDRITVEDIWGDVTQINLRTTVVNSTDNVSVIIPNSKLLENNLINWSYGDPKIRIHVPVGVAYGSDIDAVTEAIRDAAAACDDVLPEPAPEVWFREFGESSLNFELVCWLPRSNRREQAKDRLNRAIDRNFRAAHIEIPYPQQDLHIRPSDAELRVRLVADPGVFPAGTKLEQVQDGAAAEPTRQPIRPGPDDPTDQETPPSQAAQDAADTGNDG